MFQVRKTTSGKPEGPVAAKCEEGSLCSRITHDVFCFSQCSISTFSKHRFLTKKNKIVFILIFFSRVLSPEAVNPRPSSRLLMVLSVFLTRIMTTEAVTSPMRGDRQHVEFMHLKQVSL